MPRAPCSPAITEALTLPPPPVPSSPGDAGVGAAFSHGESPVAVPAITWPSPEAMGWTSGICVVGVGRGVLVDGAADFAVELEQPAATSASATEPTRTRRSLGVRERM